MILKISGKKSEFPAPLKAIGFEIRPGGWVIATLESGERVRFAFTQVGKKLGFNIAGRSFYAELQEETRNSASHSGQDSDLSAQFPGKVRKILVKEGAQVEAGEILMLLEAMKMEFQIKAPSKGTVKKVLVKETQQLSPGDLLVDFEAVKRNG
jgi:biotin carboxyl carrier protein